MCAKIYFLCKKGFSITKDYDLVKNVLKELERNGGHCPTKIKNRFGHDQCPCSEYLQHDNCYCGLYVKDASSSTGEDK